MTDEERVDAVLALVRAELVRAMGKFPPLHSPHEAIAVIGEEVDELWEHVKGNMGTLPAARQESIQIAAMACRYVLDCSAHGWETAVREEQQVTASDHVETMNAAERIGRMRAAYAGDPAAIAEFNDDLEWIEEQIAVNQQLRDALERIAKSQPSSEDSVTLAKCYVSVRGIARETLVAADKETPGTSGTRSLDPRRERRREHT